jgi:hypothetical protein
MTRIRSHVRWYTPLIMTATLATLVLVSFFRLPAQPQNLPHIAKVENSGLLFTDNRAGVTGADAGYSIPIGARTLWLFGDVFLQNPTAAQKPIVGSLSNCGLLAGSGRGPAPLKHYSFLTDTKTGLARQLIPRLPDEDDRVRLWPFGGWYDRRAQKAYLFYARVHVTGDGPLNFHTDGQGISVADARNPAALTFTRLPDQNGSLLWWPSGPEAPVFGSAVLERDGMLYVFGYRDQPDHKAGVLARVPTSKVIDSSAYTYFRSAPDKPTWTSDPAQASDVEGLSDFPTELSVSFNSYLGGFLAVHSVMLGEKARLSLAPNPWGPYRLVGEIDTLHQPFAKTFCYAGKEHPELAEDHGRVVYVTFVDGSRYWLQLLKVTVGR